MKNKPTFEDVKDALVSSVQVELCYMCQARKRLAARNVTIKKKRERNGVRLLGVSKDYYREKAYKMADEIAAGIKPLRKLFPQKLRELHDEVFLQQAIKLHVEMKDPGCNSGTVTSYPGDLTLILRREIPRKAKMMGFTNAQLTAMYQEEREIQQYAQEQELFAKCIKAVPKPEEKIKTVIPPIQINLTNS